MPTQYTPNYNLPYPQATDPVRDGQVNMQALAQQIDTVLKNGSFPPGNPDLNDVLSRLNAIEAFDAKAPLGLVALVSRTSSTGSSTGQQIVSSIPSFTFKAGRWYEIEWTTGVVNKTGASSAPLAQIFSCSTSDSATSTTGLTELGGWNLLYTGANQTARVVLKRKIQYSVDTTLQIKASLNGNTQDCYAAAGPTWPQQLSITDLGANL